MADIDKAIGSDDLIDLDVENKDKSINVEVPVSYTHLTLPTIYSV